MVQPSIRVEAGTGEAQKSLLQFYTRVTKQEHLMPESEIPELDVSAAFKDQVRGFSPSSEGKMY